MFIPKIVFSTLSALGLLASTAQATPYRQTPESRPARRQTAPGFVNVPLAELQMLRSKHNLLSSSMSTYLATSNSSADSQVAQLNHGLSAYKDWIDAFLSKYADTNTTGIPSTIGAPNSAPYALPSNSSSSSSFDASSSKNIAVYYGQSPATENVTLDEVCQDKNVDIVILAFLKKYIGPGGYPTVNFGGACGNIASAAANASNAKGLLSCPELANNITTCQSLGKKVLLSLGGANGTTELTSNAQATAFAWTIWNLFGGGEKMSDLRPFGAIKVDGFDIDNENNRTEHYNTLVSAIRKTYGDDKSKQYYISAAPQCPRPDASIPLPAMRTMDFVFVQFYNNEVAGCNIGQPGFIDSFTAWSKDLSGNSTILGRGPKLYVGAPACPGINCAGKGYVDGATMGTAIKSAQAAGVSNFGGVMLWDAAEAKMNVGNGSDYLQVVKSALTP